MFIGAHEAEYMFVTTLLKIEQHLLAQGRCPYKLFSDATAARQLTLTRREPIHGGNHRIRSVIAWRVLSNAP